MPTSITSTGITFPDATTQTTAAGAGGFSNMEVFNNPGTWTNPGNVSKVKVRLVGGGAGASTGANGPNWKYGSPGGGYAEEVISLPTGTNVPVTVGNGGTGANYANPGPTNRPGNPGGTSSFGGYCSATGGTANNGPTINLGGTGSGGQINATGGAMGDQSYGSPSVLGAGGRSQEAGRLYGGGAGVQNSGVTPSIPMTGAKGVVIVEY